MKKGLAIFLSIIYLIVVSGITFQLHYCGGELASIKIGMSDGNHSCPCGSKKMKKGCCQNQFVYVKVNADQKNSTTPIIPTDSAKNIAIQLPSFELNYTALKFAFSTINYHSPPPRSGNPLLIFNSTFRI